MYLWEVVSFSHRLTVVVFVLFLSRRAVWMVGALLSFSVAYTVLQFFFWPFVDRNVNRVEASQVQHPPLSTRFLIGAKRVEGEGGCGMGNEVVGMWGRRGVVCCCLYEFFAVCELSLAHRSLSSNLKLAQFVATFALVFSGVLFYSGELRTSADELAVLVAIAITGTSTILVVCLFFCFLEKGGGVPCVCTSKRCWPCQLASARLSPSPPCFDHPFHLQSLSAPTSLGRGGGVCGGLWV